MSRSDIVFLLFSLALVANVIALVRHWQMLRIMRIVLNNLILSQNQFNELMEAEQKKETGK
jgi:hypothetical protein